MSPSARRILELGVRGGNSTAALLACGGRPSRRRSRITGRPVRRHDPHLRARDGGARRLGVIGAAGGKILFHDTDFIVEVRRAVRDWCGAHDVPHEFPPLSTGLAVAYPGRGNAFRVWLFSKRVGRRLHRQLHGQRHRAPVEEPVGTGSLADI